MHHAQHCTLPIHPRTGLRAVGVLNGRPVRGLSFAAPAKAAKSGRVTAGRARGEAERRTRRRPAKPTWTGSSNGSPCP